MSFARECGRKAFHMLSLAYLAAYHLIGYPGVLAWMAAWTALVTALEFGRLRAPSQKSVECTQYSTDFWES